MCVLQIDSAEGDDQLRSLFNDTDNESILLEMGFRLALCVVSHVQIKKE